jgi:hypothetical protein
MLQLNLCLCKPFFGQLEQQTHVPSIHLQQWQQEQLKEWENNYGLWKISLLWRCFKWCHVALWKFRFRFEASGLPPLNMLGTNKRHTDMLLQPTCRFSLAAIFILGEKKKVS